MKDTSDLLENVSILLIEDNRDDEWLALRVLDKMGLRRVAVARDGLTALRMLLGNQRTGEGVSCVPNLVMLDLRLPKIDGLEVLRKIRGDALTSGIDVVALTSSDDPRDIEVCGQLGVLAFFSKPPDQKALLKLICGKGGKASHRQAAHPGALCALP